LEVAVHLGPDRVVLDRQAFAGLIRLLEGAGTASRELPTGGVTHTQSADLAWRLRILGQRGEEFRPDASERRVLLAFLRAWTSEPGNDSVPASALALYERLADYERRH